MTKKLWFVLSILTLVCLSIPFAANWLYASTSFALYGSIYSTLIATIFGVALVMRNLNQDSSHIKWAVGAILYVGGGSLLSIIGAFTSVQVNKIVLGSYTFIAIFGIFFSLASMQSQKIKTRIEKQVK